MDCIFTNLGSDHPAFIEAFADIDAEDGPMPRIIVCPHEMTALSAAHGYAMRTRKPQMVLVHVDVGTQNLGCSIHNAARERVPAIIVAGLSPVSVSGERVGSRTEFIHYTQNSTRQHEIGGQYMKWSYELRAAEMVDQVLMRGIQIATTAPEGPVYLTGAREVHGRARGLGRARRRARAGHAALAARADGGSPGGRRAGTGGRVIGSAQTVGRTTCWVSTSSRATA